MPRKKSTSNQYFNSDVEDAVHQYNISTSQSEKNKLFRIIYPALFKIAEVWYNKIKPTYVELSSEDLQADCLSFLCEKLHMIKEGKGKAFSYLTVTARNFYIQENMKGYKVTLKKLSLDSMPPTFDVEETGSDRVERMEINGALFDAFLEYIEFNFDKLFTRPKHKTFGECLIRKVKENTLNPEFTRRDMLNKIAAETGIDRGIVTKHLSKIASQFSLFKEYYVEFGKMPEAYSEKLSLSEKDKEYIKTHYKHYSKRNGLQGISRQLGVGYDLCKEFVDTM